MVKGMLLLVVLSVLVQQHLFAQIVLKADGPGDTYELISSVLAPGYDAVEVPDCGHAEFGRHIDEVFDTTLNAYVFRFFMHKTPDSDRCINFDRQRNEIKTYDQSPDNLLGTVDETVRYQWKFKLDSGFQVSSAFTHLHQLKAVGGSEESMPLITLTARKGSPDQLELRYAESTSQLTLHKVDLNPFKGTWVDVSETVRYGESGSYSIVIKSIKDSTILLEYASDSLRTWKTDAEFIRPKWGIYRSLSDAENLRDETVLFADFSIEEPDVATSAAGKVTSTPEVSVFPNPASDEITFSGIVPGNDNELTVYDRLGRQIAESQKLKGNTLNIAHFSRGLYFVELRKNKQERAVIKLIKK